MTDIVSNSAPQISLHERCPAILAHDDVLTAKACLCFPGKCLQIVDAMLL